MARKPIWLKAHRTMSTMQCLRAYVIVPGYEGNQADQQLTFSQRQGMRAEDGAKAASRTAKERSTLCVIGLYCTQGSRLSR